MDRTNLSQDAVALVAGRLAGAMCFLAGMMVLARLLTREQYGLYQQVWLVYNTVLPFMMMGLPGGVTYFVPQMDTWGQKAVLINTIGILGLGGVITGVGTYLFADSLAGLLGGQGLGDLLRAFVWYPMVSFPLLAVDVFLIATHRAKISAELAFLSALVQLAAVVIPVWFGYDLASVLIILTSATLAKLLLFQHLAFYGHRGTHGSWDLALLKRQLAYCIPLGLAAVLGTLALEVDKLIVAGYFSPDRFALYEVGARELPFAGIVSGSIMAVLTPEFVRLYSRHEFERVVGLWHAGTIRVAVIFFPVTAFLLVAAPDLIPLLFSDRYRESVAIFQITLLLLPLRATQYGSLLMAAGRSRLVLSGSALAMALKVALNLALIPFFGLHGAAAATVFTVYLVVLWLLMHCVRVLEVPFKRVLPWIMLARIALFSAAPAVVAYAFARVIEPGALRLGACGLTYAAAAIPFFWLNAECRDLLRALSVAMAKSIGLERSGGGR
ncbi:MAG: oligosaccharide flippase family protein [Deltaproteobacteria bacterium]|nr:oligosaccharide flippase family protein [Deltaproteobacteria bacterium]